MQISDITADKRIVWSMFALHVGNNEILMNHNSEAIMETASIPKVFLLWKLSQLIEDGSLDPLALVQRDLSNRVGGSGLWNQLSTDSLSVNDAATLVGAVSDNVATNALLHLVGLSEVRNASRSLGCSVTRLNDYVRANRDLSIHPSSVSQGNSGELARVFARLEESRVREDAVTVRLINWLKSGVDLSMIPRNFGLDPSSYGASEEGVSVWNKTGTDEGVRADTGVVIGSRGRISYSVIANWHDDTVSNRQVLESMGKIGLRIRNLVL